MGSGFIEQREVMRGVEAGIVRGNGEFELLSADICELIFSRPTAGSARDEVAIIQRTLNAPPCDDCVYWSFPPFFVSRSSSCVYRRFLGGSN
jgi:hypothetical protein